MSGMRIASSPALRGPAELRAGRYRERLLRRTGALAYVSRRSVGRIVARRGTAEAGKRLIFHIGFRKTGTSSIQALLERNAERLDTEIGVVTLARDPALVRLVEAGIAHAQRLDWRTALLLEMEVERLAERLRAMPQPTVIVSEESIPGVHAVTKRGDTFHLAARVFAVIEKALADFDLQWVIYTRSRESWLRSWYNEGVRLHGVTEPFEDWIAANASCRDWDEGLEALRAALRSPVETVSMETELADGAYLGERLLRLAGPSAAALDQLEVPGRQRESLNEAQLRFMRKINALDLPMVARRRIGNLVARRRDLFRS